LFFFSRLWPAGIRGFNILVVGGERELGERGEGGKGLLFSVPVWEEARRAFLMSDEYGGMGKGPFFFLSLLLIFLLGGGGVWALFIYFSCYSVGQQQKGESIFFVVFFCLCRL